MTKNEKLLTLLKIAKENGWENIPVFCTNLLDGYYDLHISSVMLHNNRTYENYNELSMNNIIGDFEPNIVSFAHGLFNYAYNRNTMLIYDSIIAKLKTNILLPTVYDARELLPANWFSMPTSKRLDWFLNLFTPLIEHYGRN